MSIQYLRWSLIYLRCNLSCDSPILEALWFTLPCKSTIEIWNELSKKSTDIKNNEDLILILRKILRDSHWDVRDTEPAGLEAMPITRKGERIVVDWRTIFTIIEQRENFGFSFSIREGCPNYEVHFGNIEFRAGKYILDSCHHDYIYQNECEILLNVSLTFDILMTTKAKDASTADLHTRFQNLLKLN